MPYLCWTQEGFYVGLFNFNLALVDEVKDEGEVLVFYFAV